MNRHYCNSSYALKVFKADTCSALFNQSCHNTVLILIKYSVDGEC